MASPEQEIIDGLRSTDLRKQRQAVDDLSRQIRAPLVSYVCANGGNRQAAIDILQDVLTTIYQLVTRQDFNLQPGSKLSTYALSIGYNLWLKELRMRKVHAAEGSWGGDRPPEVEEQTPLDKLVADEQLKRYWKAFQSLSPSCQQLLRLWMSERSPSEIMNELGFSNEGSIRVKRFKCQEHLKELYNKLRDSNA